MSPGRSIRVRGASLIEVMLAVALTAVTALGLIATQLWIAREARAAAQREHAAFLADALVEAARAPGGSDAALRQWKTRTASLLPQGDASITGYGGGISFARVTWSAASMLLPAVEFIDKPESCGDAALPAGKACLAMAFVP
ncbi:hypothetical protein [Paraburkholderia sp. DHOC27]|uniref:type IV pilus modification PilV family protein n=1 Tax=Paraburkholderia sp. DHOC27 TaxID=2303330 RepID=UPI000E3B5777|nr:hypothetical protein [Paraburkholderia sp. DHOC27]RFU46243.1 hypothetical protein D0B32_19785 [Paraburkholderia sp. DHOC27]